MNVLVACEESQEVCKAFRAKGHRAFSCDLQECSGGHPEWHICGDVLQVLNPCDQTLTGEYTYHWHGIKFYTMDGELHLWEGKWDLIIAHPPCTDLAVSGARWFAEKQKDFRQQKSVAFFMQMALANAERVAVENPIGIMSNVWRKPDQIIQPYEYGHATKKATCLWLKNLPKLKPTNIVEPEIVEYVCKNGKIARFGKGIGQAIGEDGKKYGFSDPMTAKLRSKTFPGIAKAMADQWG